MTPVGNDTGASPTSAGASTGMPTATGSMTNGATTAPMTGTSSVASMTTTSGRATATMSARQATSAGSYVPPVVPTLPQDAVVGIWFGSNAVSITLTGSTNGCVNGLGNSLFGQV